jgi:hypothetical protein
MKQGRTHENGYNNAPVSCPKRICIHRVRARDFPMADTPKTPEVRLWRSNAAPRRPIYLRYGYKSQGGFKLFSHIGAKIFRATQA